MALTEQQWERFIESCQCKTTMNNCNAPEPILDFKLDVQELDDVFKDALELDPDGNIENLKAVLKRKYPNKERINIVLRNFIVPLKHLKQKIHQIRANSIHKLLYFDGIVRTSTDVMPRIETAIFLHKNPPNCVAGFFEVLQTGDELEEPNDTHACSLCGAQPKKDFEFSEDDSVREDYQIVNMEEEPEGMKGRQPERMECQLHGPFTKEGMRVGAGERVTVVGIYRTRMKGKKIVLEKYVEILGIESKGKSYEDYDISAEDEAKFQEMSKNPNLLRDMSSNIAPTIVGLDIEKDAIMLQHFGGNLHSTEKRRGDIHIGLIGDPSCLCADTIITNADGTSMRISNAGVAHLDDINLDLMTDTDEGHAVANVFHKYENQPIMELMTESGKIIRGTYNHPLLVCSGEGNIWKRLDELSVGEYLVTVPQTICTKTNYIETEWVKCTQSPYGPRSRCILPTQVDEKLGALLGYITGDGWVTKSSVNMVINESEVDLVPILEEYILSVFGMYASKQYRETETQTNTILEITDRCLREIIKPIMPLQPKRRVQDLILASGNKVVAEYLAWLFEADGHSMSGDRGHYGVALRSSSMELLRDVQTILLRFNIHSRVRNNRLTIGQYESISRFHKYIGFRSNKKKTKLNNLIEYRKDKRKRHDVFSERIISIKNAGFECVYDVEVPTVHQFIANGIVSHNTGKSQIARANVDISPHCMRASGAPTTGAGITAACVQNPQGGFILEAGAAVLADKGLLCLDEDTLVITERGIIKIKDVIIGDKIINENGIFVDEVINNIDNGRKECIKIEFYSGDSIICTPEHKILSNRGWIEAKDITDSDSIKIQHENSTSIADYEKFELGFIHGFAVCDMFINEKSKKNTVSFSAATHNTNRSEKINELVKKHYGVEFKDGYKTDMVERCINDKLHSFSPSQGFYISSKELKNDINNIFNGQMYSSIDYRIGFISGILSTDTCVSHKKGKNGIKHVIEIGIGRTKYSDEWLLLNQKNITSMFHSFGIMAVIRGRKIVISSLRSYNRVVELFGEYVIGTNKKNLYHVEHKRNIMSIDDILDNDTQETFKKIRFNTSKTVSNGIHSRIWYAVKHNLLTETLMTTLSEDWNEICDEKIPIFNKNYILNPVKSISNVGFRNVRDLSINGNPSFMVAGGIVHNCIDEFDKMNETARGSLHEIMEDGTATINKGGISATLMARCSVLALMNPKNNRFDMSDGCSLSSQIDLPPSLISRFDFMFALTDKVDQKKDRGICDAVFNGRDGNVQTTKYKKEDITKYIIYARSKIKEMTITQEARDLMTEKYVALRQSANSQTHKDTIVVTSRQLEGMARIAEAHAKIRLSNVVDADDAKVALYILDHYLRTMCVDMNGEIDSDVMYGKPKAELRRERDLLSVLHMMVDEQGGTRRVFTFDEVKKTVGPSLSDLQLEKELKKLSEMEQPRIYYHSKNEIRVYKLQGQ